MKPKEGDCCVGIITDINYFGDVVTVPGLVHPEYPQCNNKAYACSRDEANMKGLYVGKVHWFEYRKWPFCPTELYWQPMTQEEIEIEINRQEQ